MKNEFMKRASALRRKEAEKSVYAFYLTYLAKDLKFPLSAAHIEIYDELTSMFQERGRKYAVAGPREFGKTKVITETGTLYSICYSKEKFIVVISSTESRVMTILRNIKKELTENQRIREDFPEIFEQNGMPKPPRWTRHSITTRNGVEVLALSWNQNMRGRRHGKSRPEAIYLDDVENSDNTFTHESRTSVREWFTREILRAGSETTNFFLIGNLLHQDCLLAEYLDPNKHPTWTKKIYRAIVSEPVHVALWEDWSKIFNGQKDFLGQKGPQAARTFYDANKILMDEGALSLWPEQWDYYRLRVMYEEDPMSFTSEMMNRPFDPKKRQFNIDEFHYWNKLYRSYEELVKAFPKLEFYAGCDPSLGASSLSDFSAIVVLAKDPDAGTIYVVVADIKRRTPNEIVSDMVAYQMRFKCEEFGYEINQFQKLLVQQIEEEAKKCGVRMPLKEITSTKDKVRRIQSLDRWVRNGTIQFSQEHRLLLEQLRDFPQGRFDDGPDCLEITVEIAQEPKGKFQAFSCGGGRSDEDWGPWNRLFGR